MLTKNRQKKIDNTKSRKTKMNKTKHIVGSIARTLLALTFLFSGFVKAVDPLGTVYKIEDYLNYFSSYFYYL